MGSPCSDIRNEFSLNHPGTSQSERQSDALDPNYVKVDERTFADWIVFVRDYSRFVQYFNSDNTAEGNWEDFWSANPAIILANLAAASIDNFREAARQLLIELEKLEFQDNTASDNEHLQQHFQRFFDLFTTTLWQFDRHISLLPDTLTIKDSLRSRINQQLSTPFQKWIAWHKHAANGPNTLVDVNTNTLSDQLLNFRVLGASILPTENFYSAPPTNLIFSDDWLPDGEIDWSTYIQNITEDATVFGAGIDVPTDISAAIKHFFFTGVYEQFIQSFALIISESEKALEELLFNWNKHEPHFALFLAFLRLLTEEQASLNSLTDRHLRFYYERVLRIFPLAPKPHQAYLTTTLAKHVSDYQLPIGTQFRAGKDETGQEILFELTEDFVPNKATVTELRSLFKAPNDLTLYQFGDVERPIYSVVDQDRYFASFVSNSADGMGENDLDTPEGRWHPFGNRSVDLETNNWKIDMPRAEVGFAISSHYLFCRQGKRIISLKFEGASLNALNGVKFKILLSIEKGWLEKEVVATSNEFQLSITIDADEDPILPIDPKVHEGDFDTSFPVLKAYLVHEDTVNFPYQALKNTLLSQIQLKVAVEDKRDMSWSGSTGPLDVSKPFHPFGPAPGTGSVFVMGDKEVFQKKAKISLHFTWKQPLDSTGYYTENLDGSANSQLQLLDYGEWTDKTTKKILPDPNTSVDLEGTDRISIESENLISPDFTENQPYSAKTTAGYLRFKLNGDWGHALYPTALAEYAKSDPDATPPPTVPNPLYDPQLLEVSLDYEATQSIVLNGSNATDEPAATFYQLHPFGLAARHGGNEMVEILPELVPQSNTITPDGPQNNVGKDGGEWLIGIEEVLPSQVLSLLIQVAPGTADPLLEKPKNHVQWSYLIDNDWTPFEDKDVADGTQQLLQSGLLRLTIPKDANTNHTLLPSGKTWIKATVETGVDAVNQIIGVHAQAFPVIMSDNSNDTALGALPLPAGTIAKLSNPLAAIKKVVQPYATFGGSAEEKSEAYYNRTSETLRHKGRAITQWDFERILLQEFSHIHKIKCLNHLRYEPGTTIPIYRELAPGHVTLISVADLRQLNGVDHLRPYTSLADLTAMHKYLSNRTSCFAELHVRNPQFEPVRATFKVRLHTGYDRSFYEKQLNQDIVQHLSPWAFDNDTSIEFSTEMSKSVLINFIEERIYVDYLEDFVLSHTTDLAQQDVETVRPTKQVSILVSAREHNITVIDTDITNEWNEDCGCAEEQIQGQVMLVRQQ